MDTAVVREVDLAELPEPVARYLRLAPYLVEVGRLTRDKNPEALLLGGGYGVKTCPT